MNTQGKNSGAQTIVDGSHANVCILGGGLAGIAAATRLAQHGVKVTLIERRKRLGGRATSFDDPTTGQTLDNCQHILMGCCTNLIDLYNRLGVADMIQWHRKLYFIDAKNHIDELQADDLPAPMHMTRPLMAFKSLNWYEKISIARAMTAMMQIDAHTRERLHYITFAQWLKDQHQPRGTIDKFWSIIAVSALNQEIDKLAANYAIQVFQDGFLASENAYTMGVSSVPLATLYDTAEKIITDAGGQVLYQTAVDQFIFSRHHINAIRLKDDQRITADAYISALPFKQLAKACTLNMLKADDRLRRLDRIENCPIVGIHLWFTCEPNHPVMTLPHAALLESPLHWVFNKGYDENLGAQYLHGVVSAAFNLAKQSPDQIINMAVAEIEKRIPGATHAKLIQAKAIKEHKATFSPEVGFETLRPTATGDINNLILAGDWCKTGWPATMEGAVRSGYLAAGAILSATPDSSGTYLAPELPPADLYRLINPQRA